MNAAGKRHAVCAVAVAPLRHGLRVAKAQEDVLDSLGTAGIRTVSISGKETEVALHAFARYGKRRGHPAQLDLADCFAFAAAESYQTSLLFKGNDFEQTDIRPAMTSRRP